MSPHVPPHLPKTMDLRAAQRPFKDRYRRDPGSARITLRATGSQGDLPVACSIDLGRAVMEAQAHAGVSGPGTGPCSGDMLLAALAACAQITGQMVAAALGIPLRRFEVGVEGDLDLRGTLGIDKDVPVGFSDLRLRFEVEAPEATEAQLKDWQEKTERYCVILQTLRRPPVVTISRPTSG